MRRYLPVGLVLVAVAILSFVLPLSDWTQALSLWIRGAGVVGVTAYAGVFLLFSLTMLPASIITVAAGVAYGPVWGTLLVMPVSVLSSAPPFQIARLAARSRIAEKAAADPRFAAIDVAVARQGVRLVTLLRLSPLVPFNVMNYVLGLTRVSMSDYVLGTAAGLLPSVFLYVYIGSLGAAPGSVDDADMAATAGKVIYWGGLVATVVATFLITRTARRSLDEALTPSPGDQTQTG